MHLSTMASRARIFPRTQLSRGIAQRLHDPARQISSSATAPKTRASSADTGAEGQQEESGVSRSSPGPSGLGGYGRSRMTPLSIRLGRTMFDEPSYLERALGPEFTELFKFPFGHRDMVDSLPKGLDFDIDVMRRGKEYILTAEVPGISKDQVEVTVDAQRVLHIKAQKTEKHEEEQESIDKSIKWYAKERTYGKFERIFELPTDADEDNINVRMKDGVLTVKIAKHADAIEQEPEVEGVRKIKIN